MNVPWCFWVRYAGRPNKAFGSTAPPVAPSEVILVGIHPVVWSSWPPFAWRKAWVTELLDWRPLEVDAVQIAAIKHGVTYEVHEIETMLANETERRALITDPTHASPDLHCREASYSESRYRALSEVCREWHKACEQAGLVGYA